jgi:hypothetical protein
VPQRATADRGDAKHDVPGIISRGQAAFWPTRVCKKGGLAAARPRRRHDGRRLIYHPFVIPAVLRVKASSWTHPTSPAGMHTCCSDRQKPDVADEDTRPAPLVSRTVEQGLLSVLETQSRCRPSGAGASSCVREVLQNGVVASAVSLFDRRGRFFVPTCAQGGAARSRGQDWPQATAGGGAQRS